MWAYTWILAPTRVPTAMRADYEMRTHLEDSAHYIPVLTRIYVYMYLHVRVGTYSRESPHSPIRFLPAQRIGAVHGEDLAYIFGAPLAEWPDHFSRNFTKQEVALSEALMIYVGNFARTG